MLQSLLKKMFTRTRKRRPVGSMCHGHSSDALQVGHVVEALELRLVLTTCQVQTWHVQCGVLELNAAPNLTSSFDIEVDPSGGYDLYVNSDPMVRLTNLRGVIVDATHEGMTGHTELFIGSGVTLTTIYDAGAGTDDVFGGDGDLFIQGSCSSTSTLNVNGSTDETIVYGVAGTLNFVGATGAWNGIVCTTGMNTITTSDDGSTDIILHGTSLIDALGKDFVDATGKLISSTITVEVSSDGASLCGFITRTNIPKVTVTAA